jgi:hypothetical protein
MDLSKFIYHQENAFSDEFCDRLINLFDEKEKEDEVSVGSMAGGLDLTIKNTTEINLYDFPELVNHENFFSVINKHLSDHFLNNLPFRYYFDGNQKIFPGNTTYETCQIQKYKKGEGHYGSWHIEIENLKSASRIFSMIVYLNDVEEGGETGFLYPEMKVKPTKGGLVIFPSAYPFVHCGFKPISNDKYIVATWLIYTD